MRNALLGYVLDALATFLIVIVPDISQWSQLHLALLLLLHLVVCVTARIISIYGCFLEDRLLEFELITVVTLVDSRAGTRPSPSVKASREFMIDSSTESQSLRILQRIISHGGSLLVLLIYERICNRCIMLVSA